MSGKTLASEQRRLAFQDWLGKAGLTLLAGGFGALVLFLCQQLNSTNLRLKNVPTEAMSSVATSAQASELTQGELGNGERVSVVDDMHQTSDNLSGFQQRGRDPSPPRMRESGMYAGGQFVEPGFTSFYKSSLTGLVAVLNDVNPQVFDLAGEGCIYIKWDSVEQATDKASLSPLFLILRDADSLKQQVNTASGVSFLEENFITQCDKSRYVQIKETEDHHVSCSILGSDPTVTVLSFPGAESGEIVLLSFGPDLSTLTWGEHEGGLLFQL